MNWLRRKVGGAETYLEGAVGGLAERGHELALLHETDGPPGRREMAMPPGAPCWSVTEMGTAAAVAALRAWGPDVLYVHVLMSPELEEALLDTAPAVLFPHAYYGTCISGTKTRQAPVARTCGRTLGWPCLMHYLPERCGGLSPVTMVREYRRNSRRRDQIPRYAAAVTASEHMRREYVRHGMPAERAVAVPPYVPAVEAVLRRREAESGGAAPNQSPAAGADSDGERRLLFVGRMDPLKGAHVLISALPRVRRALGRPVRLTLVGDGTEVERLRSAAAEVERRVDGVGVEFAGWLGGEALDATFARAHLLVVPSLWPEPFGLVGPEAAVHGVPAAGFAVGGISDWLRDGVNGHLAPEGPPRASRLADAVVRCLKDPAHYARLRAGAAAGVEQYRLGKHLSSLEQILRTAAGRGRTTLSRNSEYPT